MKLHSGEPRAGSAVPRFFGTKLRSVRVRLTLLNMGVLTLVLLVLLVAVHYSVRGFMLTAIDRQLAQSGALAAQTEQRAATNPELREALEAHRALLRHVSLPYRTFRAIRLFDAQAAPSICSGKRQCPRSRLGMRARWRNPPRAGSFFLPYTKTIRNCASSHSRSCARDA